MIENVENLVLEHLRAIRADIGGIKEEIREIKVRMTSLEANTAGIRRDNANLYSDQMEQIEKRLDLAN